MNFRSLCAAAWLVGLLAGPGCVQTLPLDNRPCDCAPGFRCCVARNRCVSPEEAASASCQRPGPASERADAGDGGVGGADGGVGHPVDTGAPEDTAPVDAPQVPPADMNITPPAPDMNLTPPADMTLPPDMTITPPPPDMALPPPPDMMITPPPDMTPPPPDMTVVPRDCSTGARRCLPDGRTPQACDGDGRWVTQLICELSCLEGACTACAPGERRCDLGQKPQLCSAAGQWDPVQDCSGGNQCSAGLCLCGENCNRGTLVDPPVGVVDIAAGGDAAWFHDGQKLWRVNPTSGQVTEPHPMAAGYHPVGGLAADGQGHVFWCRQDEMATGSQVMRDDAPFLAESCRDLLIDGPRLFVDGGGRVAHFPLGGGAGTTVGQGAVTAFGVSDRYVFFGFRARIISQLHRNTVANPGSQETVWEQPMPGDPIASVAVDAQNAYFAPGKVMLQLPVGGGNAAVVQQADRDIDHIVLTDSHIYWTSVEFTGEGDCAAAEVWRRSKVAWFTPLPPHRLVRDEGRCPTALVLQGDGLLFGTSATASGQAPGRIIRLAR